MVRARKQSQQLDLIISLLKKLEETPVAREDKQTRANEAPDSATPTQTMHTPGERPQLKPATRLRMQAEKELAVSWYE